MGETRRAHMMTLRLSLFIALIGVCHGLKNMADEVVPEKQQKQTTFYENDETGDRLIEVEGGCTNTPDWHDEDGATYNCDWYSQGSNCATYGSSYAGVAGETANQACCVCQTAGVVPTPQPTEGYGAGSGVPTPQPTEGYGARSGVPTPQPTEAYAAGSGFELVQVPEPKQTVFVEEECKRTASGDFCCNTPNWHDADGATYNCDFYADGSNCALYGSSYAGVLGQTANQACCVCQTASSSTGGSGAGSGVPTPQPTEAYASGSGFDLVQVLEPKQTVFVEGGCTNTPRWHDADGATYNCDWYTQGSNCATYGSSYAGVAGETANQACCVCQTASSSSGVPTPQPTEGAWTPPSPSPWWATPQPTDGATVLSAPPGG